MPLIALIVISVTGLLLTFSSVFLHGGGYQFLAILHMVSVVFTLIYIPFGKFFHIVQRPAAVGMQLFKYTGRKDDEVFACRRCQEPIDTGPYVENLRGTMRDLSLDFDAWAEYCPRCKRVLRGSAYLSHVKKGFKRPRIRELPPTAAPSSPWTLPRPARHSRLPGRGRHPGRPVARRPERRDARPHPLLLLRRPVRDVSARGPRRQGLRRRTPQPRHQPDAALPQGHQRLPAGQPPRPAHRPLMRRSRDEEFREVSWEEALDFTVSEIRRIQQAYGNDAFGLSAGPACSPRRPIW